MSKLGKIFLFGGLAVSYFIAAAFTMLIFFPVTPITYTKDTMPFKVITDQRDGDMPVVTAGHILIYEVHYCRHTDAPADVQRTLVGKVTVTLNRTTSQAEKRCAISKVANTIIPSYMPAGEYHMDLSVVYHINPLKDVTVRAKTETFKVIPPPVDENGNPVPQPILIPELNNEPGTINGGGLSDDEIRNQVAPPTEQNAPGNNQPEPPRQQQTPPQQNSNPPPVAQNPPPAEPTPQPTQPVGLLSPVTNVVCRLTLGLLLCE